jgi:tetratricopeptide (TPR) repeat protein
MSPEARTARLVETVRIKMVAAQGRGDWQEVISLGRLAEKDLALVHDLDDVGVEAALLDMMGLASEKLRNDAEAVRYYERLAALFATHGLFMEQGRALMNLGQTRQNMGALVEAAAIYEKVRDIGVRGGYFAMESKSCQGLARLAILEGRKAEGLEFAQQALIAAGLMLDDEFGQQRNEADAVLTVINCSDLASPDFDEALIHRYAGLVRALEDQADSTDHVNVQRVWAGRHAAMGRQREFADACREILALAAAPRMAQMVNVQQMAAKARARLHTLGEADAPVVEDQVIDGEKVLGIRGRSRV